MLQTAYNTPVGKRYRGYLEIKSNIVYIKELVKFYTDRYAFNEFFKDTYQDKSYSQNDIIPMQCVFLSIIILYGKCFSEAERRLIKLDANIFRNSSNEIKERHKKLIDIRNEFVAHAGNTFLESFEIIVSYNDGLHLQKSKENFQAISGQIVEQYNMNPLLDIILADVDNTLEKIETALEKELITLAKNLPAFYEKATNNKPITEEDLKIRS